MCHLILGGLGIGFSVVAIMGGFFTDALLGPVEIVANTPSAYAELRAVYGGGFAGLAFCCFYALRVPSHRVFVLGLFTLMFGLFSIARAGSALVDGAANAHGSLMHGVENLCFILLLWQWWVARAAQGQDEDPTVEPEP
tara:strand:- start:11 stop:427 length:417 start_codon:yes stop_codon:yes gene_type:complete